MSDCGCCACLSAGPHLAVANRPGLEALRYRIGVHGDFLDAMIRRLTVPATGPLDPYSLLALTTRESDDPAIAFLDAWATVADVLTFYQERIANEGFLRTATERRSILELGRLVGYTLKPGVSSSVYLAYTVDDTAKTIIPAGSKAQSIPGPDEQPQTFETTEDIDARGEWNAIKPRLHEPQAITVDNVLSLESVWVKGTSARINAGDPLLFTFQAGSTPTYAMRRAMKGVVDAPQERTEIVLEPVRPFYLALVQAAKAELATQAIPQNAPAPATKSKKSKKKAAEAEPMAAPKPRLEAIRILLEQMLLLTPRPQLRMLADHILGDGDPFYKVLTAPETDVATAPSAPPWSVNKLVKQLAAPRGIAPPSQWQFARSLNVSLGRTSDYLPRLVSSFIPSLGTALHRAIAHATAGAVPYPEFRSLHVMRRRANVFGYNAPSTMFSPERPDDDKLPLPAAITEDDAVVHLDSAAESIRSGSYVVVQRRDPMTDADALTPTQVRQVRYAETGPRTAYTVSARTTSLTLDKEWALFSDLPTGNENNLGVIRRTSILAESEELPLAQMPVTRTVGHEGGETRIDCDTVIEGLKPGRWLIVSGERVDVPGTTGTIASELVMISDVELNPIAGPGGTAYSTLVLAPEGLKYEYKRATVRIYGNVAKATHGETRNEILGGGDGAQALQTFTLHQTPLTFVSAPTVSGVVSTLAVRVNDVLWHETDSFFGSRPDDRVFVTKTANDGKVSVIFGNGREGSRLPTGPDNVRASYRSGIGKPGNVRAKQIATAVSRPLGVKDVINPLPASGGADPESRDDARRNIPVSLQAMGRIVSVQDYADFARTFAGVNKAVAVAITDGRRRIVHLTVGGAGDIEIDVHSDLYRNLVEALRAFGDPYQPFVVAPREKIAIAGSARVRVHPDYLWSSVGPKIRERLLDVFSYDSRDFGQVVFPAEVIAAIQNVAGVAYVDLDLLGSIEQRDVIDVSDAKEPGAIAGIVTDGEKNDPLPDAKITATNTQTGKAASAIADANGHYEIAAESGEYRLTAELEGFMPVQRMGAMVPPGTTITEDFVLSVGGMMSTGLQTSANRTLGPDTSFGVPKVEGIHPIVPKPARLVGEQLLPAQIAYLPPELADLFVLTEIPNDEE